MGRESASQAHFRKKARRGREERGWSQAEMAKRLQEKGIDSMYPTTVAKIEAGEREVKLDEATAVADLFEMSLDELVARDSNKRREDDISFYLRELRDNARKYAGQIADLSSTINGDLQNVEFGRLPDDFAEGWSGISERGDQVLYELDSVKDDLSEIANDASELLLNRQREHGRDQ